MRSLSGGITPRVPTPDAVADTVAGLQPSSASAGLQPGAAGGVTLATKPVGAKALGGVTDKVQALVGSHLSGMSKEEKLAYAAQQVIGARLRVLGRGRGLALTLTLTLSQSLPQPLPPTPKRAPTLTVPLSRPRPRRMRPRRAALPLPRPPWWRARGARADGGSTTGWCAPRSALRASATPPLMRSAWPR